MCIGAAKLVHVGRLGKGEWRGAMRQQRFVGGASKAKEEAVRSIEGAGVLFFGKNADGLDVAKEAVHNAAFVSWCAQLVPLVYTHFDPF